MKILLKNISAVLIIFGLFLIPKTSSAQVAGGSSDFNPNTNIVNPPESDNNDQEEESSSQTEVVALFINTIAGSFFPGGTVLSAAMGGIGRLRDCSGG